MRLFFVLAVAAGLHAADLSVVSLNLHSRSDVGPIANELERLKLDDAAIYLLQEVIGQSETRSEEADRMARPRGLNAFYRSEFQLGDGRHYGLAILSRYPLENRHVIELERIDVLFKNRVRIALAATAMTPDGPVELVNVHLDSRVDLNQRLEQLRPAVEYAAAQGRRAIVGGDMNTNPHRWLFHVVPVPFSQNQADGLVEFMKEAGFQSAVPGSQATHDVLGMRLDWIFVKGLQPVEATVNPLETSDHHALWAKLD